MLVVSDPPQGCSWGITREQSPADPRVTLPLGKRDKGCFPLRYWLQASLPMNLTESSAWGESLEVSGKSGDAQPLQKKPKPEGDAGESACAQPPSGAASQLRGCFADSWCWRTAFKEKKGFPENVGDFLKLLLKIWLSLKFFFLLILRTVHTRSVLLAEELSS